MNRIQNAIKLDFYTIRSASTALMLSVIAIVVSSLIGVATKQPVFTLAFFMVFAVLVSSTVFSINEKCRSEKLYGILPLKKSDMITGRYLYGLIIGVVGLAVAIVLTLVISAIRGNGPDIFLFLLVLALGFAYYCLGIGISFPIYFKFTYTKAYVFTMLPVYFVYLVGMLLARKTGFLNSLDQSVGFFSTHLALIPVIGVAAGLIFLAVSAVISNRIYRKKEL